MIKNTRPLSPHIFIYKPQLSSLFSVFHRASGIILALGILFFIFFIELFSYNLSYYFIYSFAFFLDYFFVWFTIGAFLIIIFNFFYHLSNGIRHIIWDFFSQQTLNLESIKKSAYFIFFFVFFLFFSFLFFL